MKRQSSLVLFVSMALVSLFSFGCGDKAKPYILTIDCDELVTRKSAAIDIIGVTALDKAKWESYPVSKYWDGDDPMRRAADKMNFEFGIGKTNHYVLSQADPDVKAKWESWMNRRVTYLVIMARLKAVNSDALGNADPRRIVLPLTKKGLEEVGLPDAKAFRLLVQEAAIRIDPLDKVPKQTSK